MVKIKEYRICMPLTLEECQIGALYTVARTAKENTGGGEGVIQLDSAEFQNKTDLFQNYSSGHYSKKCYKLANKAPWWIRKFVPKGKLELFEESWNAFPYTLSVINNQEQFKDKVLIKTESLYLNDRGTTDNAFNLSKDVLRKREIINIDIVYDPVPSKDYKESEDPSKFLSKKTGRGEFVQGWRFDTRPVICIYKLVTINCRVLGFQKKLEKTLHQMQRQMFTVFHRRIFCWIDEWYDLSLTDVRRLQEEIKEELAKNIDKGEVVGDRIDEKDTAEVKDGDEEDSD